MSPLDDARRLAEADPMESDSGCCVFCGRALYGPGDEHASDCPWLQMPNIVAALESAALKGDVVP